MHSASGQAASYWRAWDAGFAADAVRAKPSWWPCFPMQAIDRIVLNGTSGFYANLNCYKVGSLLAHGWLAVPWQLGQYARYLALTEGNACQ